MNAKTRTFFRLLSLFFVTTIFFSCEPDIKKDYVELIIPAELQDKPEAVKYLEKDAKQLNRLLNSIDQLATEFEEVTALVATVDTNDVEAIEAIRPELIAMNEDLSQSLGRIHLNLMWYLGKDIFSSEDATKGILERLDTDEGIAFRKSMDHISLKKDMLKERANTFMERMEALEGLGPFRERD